jgi:1-acyl-sn-glycerol-3-phosphate acyltransferase
MVLDDQRVATMDDASLERVMVPKVAGAWNLHRATTGLPLDHFVLFSSITSLLGNPLQANYAAANAYLDALAHQRRAMGLPGLSINWGVLAGAGYVADRPDLQRFLDQQGYCSFTRKQALKAFDIALSRAAPEIMAARIDWAQMASYSARSAASPRLAHLVPAAREQAGNTGVSSEIVATLASASAEERPAIIEAFLARSLARILGMSAEAIDADRPLDAFGLDSLLSVEFMVVLSGDLGFEMPVIALLDDMNIRTLGGLVLADLASREGSIARADLVPGALAAHRQREPEAEAGIAPTPEPATPPAPAITQRPQIVMDAPVAPSGPRPTPAAETPAPGEDWTALQKGARAISRAGLAAMGRVDVAGLGNLPAGPFILAVNHVSMADVPLALSIIPRRTVMLANAKLQRNWVLDQLVGRIGEAIYLPKTGDVMPALERALAMLREGGIIALAPEGTRNRGGLGRAETGIAWLAGQSGLPVVPYAAWGQEQWRTRFRRLTRLPLSVRIGAPIPPPSGDIGARGYADLVMYRIAELLPEEYRGAYADNVAAE